MNKKLINFLNWIMTLVLLVSFYPAESLLAAGAEPVMEAEEESTPEGEGDSAWLAKYTYRKLYDYVILKEYKGTETDVRIPASANVAGTEYPVAIEANFDCGTIKDLSFEPYVYYIFLNNDNTIFNGSQKRFDFVNNFTKINLETIDLRNLKISPLHETLPYWQTFSHFSSLRSVSMDVADMTSIYTKATFLNCIALEHVDLSGWTNYAPSTAEQMFQDCSSIETVEMPAGFKPQNIGSIFDHCVKLKNINTSSWDASELSGLHMAFRGCESLEELDLSNFNVSKVKNFYSTFSACTSLKTLNLSGWTVSGSDLYMDGMFDDCSSLEELDLSGFDLSGLFTPGNCFSLSECTALIKVKTPKALMSGAVIPLPDVMLDSAGGEHTQIDQSCLSTVLVREPQTSTHLVRFLNDDKSQIGETQTVADGGSATKPADPQSVLHPGCKFLYWETKNAAGEKLSGYSAVNNIREDRDIIAVYDLPEYYISYYNDDGSFIQKNGPFRDGEYALSVAPVVTTKLHAGEADKYKFKGWNYEPSTYREGGPISSDVKATAVFELIGSDPGPGPDPDPDPDPTPDPTPDPDPQPGPVQTVSFDGIEICFAENGTASLATYYTGAPIKPEVIVRFGGAVLKEGVDYRLKYSNNRKVSSLKKRARIIIYGMGKFSGSRSLYFTIVQKPLCASNGELSEGIFLDGLTLKQGARPKIKLYYNGRLVDRKEYSLYWNQADDNISISARSEGNFSGSIEGKRLNRLAAAAYEKYGIRVSLFNTDKYFNGNSQILKENELVVTDASGFVKLQKGRDYTICYSEDRVNAGRVKLRVFGKGNYHGSIAVSYRIRPASVSSMTVSLIPESDGSTAYSYRKAGVYPETVVTATLAGRTYTLAEGRDYDVKYSGNRKVGNSACASIRFKGNFKGCATVNKYFSITPADLSDAEVYVCDMKYDKPGEYRSKPVVILNGELVSPSEYKVSYLDENESELRGKLYLGSGEERDIRILVNAKNKNYCGRSGSLSYTVRDKADLLDISAAKISLMNRKTSDTLTGVQYSSKEIRFDPADDERAADLALRLSKNYGYLSEDIYKYFEVIYADHIAPGKASVILIPKDGSEHSGICKGSFKIKKKKFREIR
ncbi:MAG: BspA family leucine-rich repeat surface protein [Lachnospiraceae bacterium]|nr:BspA family leucine-rich repeat surface protein [Lachnospiraceae bacterium]